VLRRIEYLQADATNSSYYDFLMDEIASVGSPVVVLVVYQSEAVDFFAARDRHATMSSDSYLWVGSDGWIGYDDVDSPRGSIGLIPQPFPSDGSGLGEEFMELWKSLDPVKYFDSDDNRNTTSPYSTYAIDAVVAMSIAVQELVSTNYNGTLFERRQEQFQIILRDVGFTGVTGEVDFDDLGNRITAQYDILNNVDGLGSWKSVGKSRTSALGYFVSVDESEIVWPDGVVGGTTRETYYSQSVPVCSAGYEPLYLYGEYSCSVCPVGTYKPTAGTEQCSGCPEGANCNNVAIAIPCVLAGYWRATPPASEVGNFDKWKIFKCDINERCLGGCVLNETCAENVIGTSPVCAICQSGYYTTDDISCLQCPAETDQDLKTVEYFFILVIISVVIGALFTLYIHSVGSSVGVAPLSLLFTENDSVRESDRDSDRDSRNRNSQNRSISGINKFAIGIVTEVQSRGLFVTVKLTVSFIQVLSGALGTLDVNWSSSMQNFLRTLKIEPTQAVPFFSECSNSTEVESLYVNILLILFIPIGFLLIAGMLYWFIRYLIRRSSVLATGQSKSAANNSLRDITLKSVVWFFLFSFPFLTQG
jgi:hypothetical protein